MCAPWTRTITTQMTKFHCTAGFIHVTNPGATTWSVNKSVTMDLPWIRKWSYWNVSYFTCFGYCPLITYGTRCGGQLSVCNLCWGQMNIDFHSGHMPNWSARQRNSLCSCCFSPNASVHKKLRSELSASVNQPRQSVHVCGPFSNYWPPLVSLDL